MFLEYLVQILVVLLKILDELKNAGRHGYELTTHLYKFEEYGIPQARHRYIVVGIRERFKIKI